MTPWVPVDKFFLFGDSITQYSADQFGRGPSTDFVFKAKLDQGQYETVRLVMSQRRAYF